MANVTRGKSKQGKQSANENSAGEANKYSGIQKKPRSGWEAYGAIK
jgi:hypothetical protein